MAIKIELPKTWVWDGKKLKPKSGATSKNTWVFDGEKFKPYTGATSKNTWVFDGKIIKKSSMGRLKSTKKCTKLSNLLRYCALFDII